MAETTGLLNRRTGHSVPRVRISSSPQQNEAQREALGFFRTRPTRATALGRAWKEKPEDEVRELHSVARAPAASRSRKGARSAANLVYVSCLNAKRWAFFVQGRQERQLLGGLGRKSPRTKSESFILLQGPLRQADREKAHEVRLISFSPLKSGLQVSLGLFFYLVSPENIQFLNFGRRRTRRNLLLNSARKNASKSHIR